MLITLPVLDAPSLALELALELGATVTEVDGVGVMKVVVVVSPEVMTEVTSTVSVEEGEVEPGKEGRTSVVETPSVIAMVVEPCAAARAANRRTRMGAIMLLISGLELKVSRGLRLRL